MSVSNLGALCAPGGVSIIRAEFTGGSSAGNLTVTGVKEGDIVLTVYDTTDANYELPNRVFRSVAPADDTLYQGSGGYGSAELVAILLRPAE